ncbi:MAG: YgjP-like metallopeptidase domain-containing protein, partial [Carnobacterium sp.]
MEYNITRSKRKTTSLTVDNKGVVQVRTSFFMKEKEILEFIKRNEKWIQKQQLKVTNAPKAVELSDADIKQLKQKAKEYIPQRVAVFEKLMDVTAKNVKINSAKTRWGSCSAQNSLNFSFRVMLLPPELIDFIVIHELCHIKQHNHSDKFYKEM